MSATFGTRLRLQRERQQIEAFLRRPMVGPERGIGLEERLARKALGLAEIAALKRRLSLVLQLTPFRLARGSRRARGKQRDRNGAGYEE